MGHELYGKEGIDFNKLVKNYINIQSKVAKLISSLSVHTSTATPGQFLMAQFQMSQMAQIGEGISNLFSLASSIVMNSIRNFKAQ